VGGRLHGCGSFGYPLLVAADQNQFILEQGSYLVGNGLANSAVGPGYQPIRAVYSLDQIGIV